MPLQIKRKAQRDQESAEDLRRAVDREIERRIQREYPIEKQIELSLRSSLGLLSIPQAQEARNVLKWIQDMRSVSRTTHPLDIDWPSPPSVSRRT